jgi:hypothetical protein
MIELGTPATLMDAQTGHEDGSVQARYSHITDGMTGRLLDGLTARWAEAIDLRRQVCRGSPVGVLDRLLKEKSRRTAGQDRLPGFSLSGPAPERAGSGDSRNRL